MKLLLLVVPLLVTAAADSIDYSIPKHNVRSGYADDYHDYARPSYFYGYRVNQPSKKLHFNKHEHRVGDRTEGSYSVLLPDGRTKTVTYWVEGDSGFQAVVKYSGKAKQPVPEPRRPKPKPYSDDDGSSGRSYPDPPKPAPFPPKQAPVGFPSDDDGSKRPFPYPFKPRGPVPSRPNYRPFPSVRYGDD